MFRFTKSTKVVLIFGLLILFVTTIFQNCSNSNFSSSEQSSKSDNLELTTKSNSQSIIVDFSKKYFFPALKSRVGFARAVSFQHLPESILHFENYMRPGMFCTEIDFDHNQKNGENDLCNKGSTDGEPNWVLSKNSNLSVENGEAYACSNNVQWKGLKDFNSTSEPNLWFQNLRYQLYQRRIKPLHQLIGAPQDYQMANIERPARQFEFIEN